MSRRGFTLIEVLLVILIISILSVAGFSGVVQVQKSAKANEIKTKIVSFINRARSYALNGRTVASCTEGNPDDIPRKYAVQIDSSDAAEKITFFADQIDPDNTIEKCEKIIDEYSDFGDMGIAIKDGAIIAGSITLFFDPTFANFSLKPSDIQSDAVSIEIYSASDSTTPLKTLSFSSRLGIPE